MTINELEYALEAFTPFEDVLKSYYFEYGDFMQESDFPDFLVKKPFSIPHSDLRYIAGSADTAGRTLYYGDETLNESVHFLPEYDVSLQKHARYLTTGFHDHEYFELCYQYSGHCSQTFRSASGNVNVDLRENDFLLVPPGQEHMVSAEGDCIMINIGIRSSTFTSAFLNVLPTDSLLGSFFMNNLISGNNTFNYIIFHTGQSVRSQMQDLMMTYVSDSIYSCKKMNLLVSVILLTLLESHIDECTAVSSGISSSVITKVLSYMEQNYNSCNVSDIARHFGYSPDHLSRLFKDNFGKSIKVTLLDIKMRKAASLLSMTRLSVAEIADYIGFRDTTNMIRNFKKTYGTTPSEYRSRTRQTVTYK